MHILEHGELTERKTWRKQDEEEWKPGAMKAAAMLGGKVGERPWRENEVKHEAGVKEGGTIDGSVGVRKPHRRLKTRKTTLGRRRGCA